MLVSHRSTDRPDLISEQLYGIMRQADRFDTIAGHVRRLFAAGWEDDGSGFIASSFQELVARGLLVSKSAFRASLTEGHGSEATPPVTSVMIPSRDRARELQRCLGSCIENLERHERRPDYVVVDDSRNGNQNAATAELLAPFAARGSRIFYAGMQEKLRFADELVRAAKGDGLPRDAVAFALFGDDVYTRTCGANRNTFLLAAPGELFVMADDDTLYQAAVLGEPDATLSLSSMRDPTDSRFYADRRELTAAVRAADIDILSCHEKLLGRSIAGCVAALGSGSALDVDMVDPESAHFFGSASRRVKSTASGLWGDSANEAPHMVLELAGESRELLMGSKDRYARAKESREVFRSVSRYTISRGAVFITMNTGIDNRSLLPPFLPVGRNNDGIFAMSLRACAQDAMIGHIPYAVLHSPLESRRYAQDAISIAAPRLSELVQTIARTFRPAPGRPGVTSRLSDFGKLFVDVGSLKMDDFKKYVQAIWVAGASRYIGILEQLLDLHHSRPDYWAHDVTSLIERLTDFTVHQCAAAPRELRERLTPDQAMETCRRMVRRYGEVLQWWPVMYSAAGRLKEAGIRLARPV